MMKWRRGLILTGLGLLCACQPGLPSPEVQPPTIVQPTLTPTPAPMATPSPQPSPTPAGELTGDNLKTRPVSPSPVPETPAPPPPQTPTPPTVSPTPQPPLEEEGILTTITDPGLVWIEDELEFKKELYGPVARGWKKWFAGPGEAQWYVTDRDGWTQEVQKSGVKIGIYRQNRGFIPGQKYTVSFQAYLAAAQQATPSAAVGIHPTGKDDFPVDGNLNSHYAELIPGPFIQLTQGAWSEISFEFTAQDSKQTIFLMVDFENVRDGVVNLADVKVEPGPDNPGLSFPWMETGRPPVEPPYIYGIHDPGAEHLFNQKNRQGWVMHAVAIGADPDDKTGRRFSEWVDGHGVIVRLSYLFGDDIPPDPDQYEHFAQRCANYVENSVGAGIWSIGNETPLESGASPAQYALCYTQCRYAIKMIRPEAQVITAGMMHGNPDYLGQVIQEIQRLRAQGDWNLGPDDLGIDGFAIHSYTNSNGWNAHTFGEFEALLAQIPDSMKHLPVYLTEAGSGPTGVEYPNENTHLIDHMFRYVHEWNQRADTQKIRSVNFYRWEWKIGGPDHWGIEHKPGMIEDFLTALDNEYYWRAP